MAKEELSLDDGDEAKPEAAVPGPRPQRGSAFDPFADSKVKTGPLAPQAVPTPAESPTERPANGAPAAKPALPRAPTPQAGGSPGRPRPLPVAADADPDLKPGSREDLWVCPHCGAGNRPDRGTCRSCAKNPRDPVAPPPVHKQPWFLPAAGGGVVLLLLLYLLFGGPSLALKPAGPDGLDTHPRLGGSGGKRQIGTRTFAAKGRIAACGRVVRSGSDSDHGDAFGVVLAFGKRARDDEFLSRIQVDSGMDGSLIVRREGSEIPDARQVFVRFHLLGLDSEQKTACSGLKRGQYLSFTGAHGSFAADDWTGQLPYGEYAVAVSELVTE